MLSKTSADYLKSCASGLDIPSMASNAMKLSNHNAKIEPLRLNAALPSYDQVLNQNKRRKIPYRLRKYVDGVPAMGLPAVLAWRYNHDNSTSKTI